MNMNMPTTSRETLERQYNTTLQLHNLTVKMHNTLNGMHEDSSEITQKIIDSFKKEFDQIRQDSLDGLLVEEILWLNGKLSNISNLTEALRICDKFTKYLEELQLHFNSSKFKKSDADATASCGNCKCANHGK